MKFKFDTERDTKAEAMALVVGLAALYGLKELKIEEPPAAPSLAETLMDHASPETLAAIITDGPAADGYPTASEAFGEPAPNTISIGSDVMAVLTGPTRDSAGIPWDERIHSSTKGTNKDGTWSRRRNTPDATFDSVMAELKAGARLPDGGKPGYVEGPDAAPPPPYSATTEVPPPPPPPPPAGDAAPITFPVLVQKITRGQSAGKITRAQVDEILKAEDIDTLGALAKATPEKMAAVSVMVDAYVGS